MRDPYDVLGVKRGASLDEIKAAYRKRAKAAHPDMAGGSEAAFIELGAAYEKILEELKAGFSSRDSSREQRQRESRGAHSGASGQGAHGQSQHQSQQGASDRRDWEKYYRDIDEELENLRRAAGEYEDRLRAMRAEAWHSGRHAAWLALTWQDITGFVRGILRGGLKGVSLIVAALMGVGGVLAQVNFASAIVVTGSLAGFFLSVALKSDKGGMMSAGILLFGLMTFWLPPVRAALFAYPLATISVLLCLALIFKFVQQGGVAGLLTGGVLAMFVIGSILSSIEPPQQAAMQVVRPPGAAVAPPVYIPPQPARPQPAAIAPPLPPAPPPPAPPQPQPVEPEPRTLRATQGAHLKFVSGVPYFLEIRSGRTTLIRSNRGQAALHSGTSQIGECRASLELSAPASGTPFLRAGHALRACGEDAIFEVVEIR